MSDDCTCHPDDNPPRPCPQKYALGECRIADAKARADAALALLAEAYEVAARECEGSNLGLDPADVADDIRALTPYDALAALEARDRRVRDEALRGVAAGIKEHTDTARKKMRMAYGTPSSGVWSAIISHLDIEYDRILALIEGDPTDE